MEEKTQMEHNQDDGDGDFQSESEERVERFWNDSTISKLRADLSAGKGFIEV